MEEGMTNIEIRDFMTVQGVDNYDYVILSLSGGSSAKIAVRLLKESVSYGITPSIQNGVWFVGENSTGINAAGRTPQFRKSELGVEYKYADEDETSWKLLVPFDDIMFTFEDLTDEQRDLLSLHFEDLTAADIEALQKPALDMIPKMEESAAKADDAAAAAMETAQHPTYIGKDYYVYQWDAENDVYIKTDIYVKGESEDLDRFYTKTESDERYYTREETDKELQSVIIGKVTSDPASILE